MTRYEKACLTARRLFNSCYDGVLSTHSKDLPGYPFGSVMPFCCDRRGLPVILVADIAQHTQNMQLDPHVSLIVFDRAKEDLQTHGRLTLLSDASKLVRGDDGDAAARYFRFYPEARDFLATHTFEFWRLTPKRVRYIGGFGDIHWLEPNDLLEPNPFSEIDEQRVIEHMNADHTAALRRYVARETTSEAEPPQMVGIDSRGIHVRTGARVRRCDFQERVMDTEGARTALIRLSQPDTVPVT